MFTHPITSHHHISSHALIGMDNSLSSVSQWPRPDHTLKPREGRRTPLTSQVKLYLGKVHSWHVGICIDRSTRNSAEVYTSHKIAILSDALPKLIPGRLPTGNGTTLSLRTGTMSEYHRHAETVRRSTWPRGTTVTPQVFSSLIALHCMSISMHHFMLIHVVATNVICFEVLCDSHHVTLGSWCN
jgi:hypothetical protein